MIQQIADSITTNRRDIWKRLYPKLQPSVLLVASSKSPVRRQSILAVLPLHQVLADWVGLLE